MKKEEEEKQGDGVKNEKGNSRVRQGKKNLSWRMDVHSRRSRHSSPERAKICSAVHHQKVISVKKVQVVYYLSRNGLLEYPHSMEVILFPSEPLRLKHVLDRLIALRVSGMPSLYSWSCKRSYKSGYVWHDLGMNDIIHPADGAEYVLKGSELLQGCSGRFQQLQVSNRQATLQEPNLNLKRKPFQTSPQREAEEYEEYEEYEDGEKTSNTSSTTTPHSRCSKGVSTDELEEHRDTTKVTAHDSPVTVSSKSTLADKNEANDNSKRFLEEGTSGSAGSRNSVLLQLIACGSSAVAKAKSAPCVSNVVKKKESVQVAAVRKSAEKLPETEVIKCMSENPRLENCQSEEKEYFNGSLVESMKAHWDVSQAQPVLKKSNSYNEERRNKKEERESETEKLRKEKQRVKACLDIEATPREKRRERQGCCEERRSGTRGKEIKGRDKKERKQSISNETENEKQREKGRGVKKGLLLTFTAFILSALLSVWLCIISAACLCDCWWHGCHDLPVAPHVRRKVVVV